MKALLTIRPRTFAGLLRIAPRSDIRYYLGGVFVEPETGLIVATDGHVLVVHRTDARVSDVAPFIIPADVLANVAKAKCRAVRVSISEDANAGERVITLECGTGETADFCPSGTTFTAKEINGRFPEWRRVVPVKPSGEPGQYDPALLANIHEAMRDICDRKKASMFPVTFTQNGANGAALMTCDAHTDTLAVIMPWRAGDSPDATLTAMGLQATAEPEAVETVETVEALAA